MLNPPPSPRPAPEPPMNVEHAFTTRLESIEAFGLSNELLRPRGFTLQEGNPSKSQQWARAGNPTARSVTRLPQTVRMELDRGRMTIRFSMEVSGKRVLPAQKLMLGYAKSLDALLNERKPVQAASMAGRSFSVAKRSGNPAGTKGMNASCFW